MKTATASEASWGQQVAVFATDSIIAFAGSLGLFRLVFDRAPNILASFDFTVIIAVNALLFSLPALIMGGATIGARLYGSASGRKDNHHRAGFPLCEGYISFLSG